MIAFLFDEDVHPLAAEIARGLGLDAVSVHELGRTGLSDREQLSFAASESRVLVTRNRDDFIRLTIEYYQASEAHFGVLIVPYSIPNQRPERIAHALRLWYEKWSSSEEPGAYFIDFLTAADT